MNMTAKKQYQRILNFVKEGKLLVRNEINDSDKGLKTSGQSFVGNDSVNVYSNNNEEEIYKVWHYISHDDNYEVLHVEDLRDGKLLIFENNELI